MHEQHICIIVSAIYLKVAILYWKFCWISYFVFIYVWISKCYLKINFSGQIASMDWWYIRKHRKCKKYNWLWHRVSLSCCVRSWVWSSSTLNFWHQRLIPKNHPTKNISPPSCWCHWKQGCSPCLSNFPLEDHDDSLPHGCNGDSKFYRPAYCG
jgi:hypothetical protein